MWVYSRYEHGPGDLNKVCSGLHYMCDKCRERVGGDWLVCAMCVEDNVHFCHRRHLRLYDPGHSHDDT